jgi:hypothetical protein
MQSLLIISFVENERLGKKETWLYGEFLRSLSSSSNPIGMPTLSIVYPTVQNVRESVEGYVAGGSLPVPEKFGA